MFKLIRSLTLGLVLSVLTGLALAQQAPLTGPVASPGPVLFTGNFDTGALVTAVGATTTQTTLTQYNNSWRGILINVTTTAIGTGSITMSLQWQDAASGVWSTLLAGAAVTTNTTNIYTVYPGAPVTANVSNNSPLPRVWRIVVTANNANAATYTVGANLIQ